MPDRKEKIQNILNNLVQNYQNMDNNIELVNLSINQAISA